MLKMEGLSTEEKFRAAVNVIRSLPKKGSFQPSNELMLRFYSYYKQATEGPCTTAKPSFWDIINKAKWEAWKGLGNMPKEEAMEHYIDELKKIVETMSYTESVAEFMDILGPFYEFVPLDDNDTKHSINDGQMSDEDNDTVVKQIVENNIDTVSMTESLKKQLKIKKCNGDIRGDLINNRQHQEACNGLNSTNGHKSNGAEDSETDEFSDTYDQITEEEKENGNGLLEDIDPDINYDNSYELTNTVILNDVKNDYIVQARGGGDQRASSSASNRGDNSSSGRPYRSRQNRDVGLSSHIPPTMHHRSSVNPGGNEDDDNGAVGGGHSVDVGEQLALAVIKLQHTMDEVVNRLDSLEILLQDKQQDRSNNQEQLKKTSWSILGLTPHATVFVILWPFFAYWIMNVMKKRRQR